MDSKMKKFILEIALLIAGLLALLMMVPGCTQIILEKDRLKINTFLKSTEFDTAYFDPNGFFEVHKYRGIPSNIELEYDPVEKAFKIKAITNAD